MSSALEGIAAVSALATYRLRVVPRVRSELRRWEDAAGAIPDPALREAALAAVGQKASNVEATAVFAILAPGSHRAGVVRAIAALQIAIDYLDTLGEQAAEDPLADGLALHGALVEAVSPGAAHSDWYRLHPQREDGGYLAALVTSCQEEIAALPSARAVGAAAQQAARRCGEGQSHTHAAGLGQATRLEDWAVRQDSASGYSWWEVAAGASSSVAAHALIAAAADRHIGAEEARLIDAAYFPPIGALTVLLDDLVDLEQDVAAGEHNYVAYYPSNTAAADRLALIVSRARQATEQLRHRRRHAAILAGIGGFYLSDPAATSEFGAPIRDRLLQSFGWTARLILATMRFGRHG
jgi:tetraprenyl-beta-curcumene synthase